MRIFAERTFQAEGTAKANARRREPGGHVQETGRRAGAEPGGEGAVGGSQEESGEDHKAPASTLPYSVYCVEQCPPKFMSPEPQEVTFGNSVCAYEIG